MKANEIIKELEKKEMITAKDIYTALEYTDGGKLLRRHLRSKFATNHNAKTSWTWAKADEQWRMVVEYMISLNQPKEPKPLKINPIPAKVKPIVIPVEGQSNTQKIQTPKATKKMKKELNVK